MSKLDAIRALLQKALMAFERISTDKALIEYDGEGELEVGMAVHGVDEEGNNFDLENGEYTTSEGTVYVIEDGKVAEIREVEKEETTGDDVQPENVTEEEEVNAAEDEPADEEAPVDDRDERIANLEAEVARLERENGELRERIAELEEKSAAEPATQEFENITKVEKTGNSRIDRLTRILNA